MLKEDVTRGMKMKELESIKKCAICGREIHDPTAYIENPDRPDTYICELHFSIRLSEAILSIPITGEEVINQLY